MTIVLRRSTDDTTRTIDDPMRERVIVEMIRYLCGRNTTCTFSGDALDFRTCTAVLDDADDVLMAISPQGWADLRALRPVPSLFRQPVWLRDPGVTP